MNRFLRMFLIFFAVGGIALSAGPSSDGNQYVRCTIELKKSSLKAGSSGEILISLKPVKGIHINTTPPMSLLLDSASAVRTSGSLAVPKKETYLDVTKQIRQSFTLPASVKPGSFKLKGTFVYYYCSDAEGWCSKFKQPVDLTITVVK